MLNVELLWLHQNLSEKHSNVYFKCHNASTNWYNSIEDKSTRYSSIWFELTAFCNCKKLSRSTSKLAMYKMNENHLFIVIDLNKFISIFSQVSHSLECKSSIRLHMNTKRFPHSWHKTHTAVKQTRLFHIFLHLDISDGWIILFILWNFVSKDEFHARRFKKHVNQTDSYLGLWKHAVLSSIVALVLNMKILEV